MLATASPHCLIQARYELHEVTTELTKQRKEDKGVLVAVGHGELRSGEVRRRGNAECDLTLALLGL